jgi:hypothetical protein
MDVMLLPVARMKFANLKTKDRFAIVKMDSFGIPFHRPVKNLRFQNVQEMMSVLKQPHAVKMY